MADIATIGFKADTSDLSKASVVLDTLAETGKKTEKSANQASAAIGSMSKPAKESASSIERYISALRSQNETLGMSNAEIRQYEARQLKASESQLKVVSSLQAQIDAYEKNAEAIAKASAAEAQKERSVSAFIASLRVQNETIGMSVSELRQYEAAQLGASQSQLKIVANLQSQIDAYQRNSVAIAAAEAAENSRKSSLTALVSLMNQQAATIGMTTKELALYKAAQLGATEEDKKAIIAAANKIEAFERSTEAMIGNSRAVNTATGSMSNARGIMQSFGYQIQDVVVQAQMGTNAFMILSQQGSQLASAFGAGGAVFGAVLAVAGVLGMVLAPALMDSKTNADRLAETMDVLSQSAERNENGILELTGEIKELARQSEIAAKAQLQAVMIKSAQAIQLASKATADMVDGLAGAGYGLYDVSDAMKELNLEFGYFGGGRSKAFTETVTEIGEKFGGAGVAAKELGVQVLKAIKTMGEAKAPEEINTAREYLLGVAAASKMTDTEMAQFIMTVNKLASDGISAADTAKLLSDSLTDGSISASNATDKMKELSQQLAIAKAEFNGGEAAAMQLALAFDLGLKSAEELTPELAAQVEELVKWRNAGKEVEKQLRRIADAESEMEDAFGGDDMLVEIYKNRAKSAEELMDKWSEGVDEYESDNRKMATISEKAAERIEEAFADAWLNAFDGFESVVDGMKNAFKRMLAEMAHMALTKPIMVSMGLGGLLPGAASASTGALSGGLGLLGGIGSGITGLGSLIGGSFGGGLMGGGALVGAGQFGTLFSGAGSLLGSGNIMAGLGMATPIIAGLGAALAGIQKLSGGGLFGSSFKTTGQSLGLSLGGGDVTGSITTEESRKRSLFRGTKRRTSTTDYDASAIDDAFDSISAALGQAANAFGITGADEIIKGFTAAANINIKDKSEAEIQAAIEEWVGNTTGALVNAVFGDSLDGLQKEGEGVIDTVARLTANMGAVQSISKTLGLGFDLTGKAAMVASTNIVELAGGLDQLSALTSQYYSEFYSEAEQQQNLATQLAASFEALNVTMPMTREGFRSIVDGLDLTTESGQQMFAALMQLVPGMDQYLTALEAQRTASEQAAEAAQKEAEAKAAALKAQGLDLQLRLYDALGQSAEALALRRQMELEATDETLRAILLQIYAAEDAASAQRELASAQDAAAQSARAAAAAATDAAQNAFGKLQDAAEREKSRLQTELDLKLESIDKEREALAAQRDSVVAGYEAQSDAVRDYISNLQGITDVINDFIGTSGGVVDPFKRLTQIFNEAKAGLIPNQSELQSVLGAINSSGSGQFGSASDAAFAIAVARNQAAGIGDIVGGKISGARSQVELIEQQIKDANNYYQLELGKLDQAAELAKKLHDEQVKLIDDQLSEAQKQLNALLGVDDRILTMSEAAAEFYAALAVANELQFNIATEQVAAIYRVESAIVQVGAQLAEMNKPLDRVWVPPTMPDRVTTDGQIPAEMIALMKELVAAADATAKHTKTSANVLELNQYEAQEAAV